MNIDDLILGADALEVGVHAHLQRTNVADADELEDLLIEHGILPEECRAMAQELSDQRCELPYIDRFSYQVGLLDGLIVAVRAMRFAVKNGGST
jgi:hypothetical protein